MPEQCKQTDQLANELPSDLTTKVILACPVSTWFAVGRLNRHYSRLVGEEAFWKRACQQHGYTNLITGPSPRPTGSISTFRIFQSNHVARMNWQRGRFNSLPQCVLTTQRSPVISVSQSHLMTASSNRQLSKLHDWKGSGVGNSFYCSAVYHHDGHWWVADASGVIQDLSSNRRWQAHGQEITSLWCQGDRLISGDLDGWVKEWSASDLQLKAAKWHGDNAIIYASPTCIVDAAGKVKIGDFDLNLRKQVTAVTEQRTNVIIIGCLDGTVVELPANTLEKYIHDCAITALHAYGDYLISGAASGLISVWNKEMDFIADIDTHRTAITCLWAEEGRIVSASLDGKIMVHYLAP